MNVKSISATATVFRVVSALLMQTALSSAVYGAPITPGHIQKLVRASFGE
jgi:hypothetical protein